MQQGCFNYYFSASVLLLLPFFLLRTFCYLLTQTSEGQNSSKLPLSGEKWYLLQFFNAFFFCSFICYCQINRAINKANFFHLAASLACFPLLFYLPDLIKVLSHGSNETQSPFFSKNLENQSAPNGFCVQASSN